MKSKGYAKFLGANKLHYGRCASGESFLPELFTAISRKVSQKMCMRQSQKVLGCCRTYFCCFGLALADICPWPLPPAILSNFFEKQWTQNHPQYLSGLSRALFPTTMYCVVPFRCVTRAEWNRDFLWQLFVSLFKRRCCVMKGSCRGIMQFGKIDSEIKLYLSAWLL